MLLSKLASSLKTTFWSVRSTGAPSSYVVASESMDDPEETVLDLFVPEEGTSRPCSMIHATTVISEEDVYKMLEVQLGMYPDDGCQFLAETLARLASCTRFTFVDHKGTDKVELSVDPELENSKKQLVIEFQVVGRNLSPHVVRLMGLYSRPARSEGSKKRLLSQTTSVSAGSSQDTQHSDISPSSAASAAASCHPVAGKAVKLVDADPSKKLRRKKLKL